MQWSSISDEDLVRRCGLTKDARAWEEFVRRFDQTVQSAVYRAARRCLSSVDRALVDDLVQEVYIKLFGAKQNKLAEFRPQHANAIHGFLRTIATNLVYDHFRALQRERRDSRLSVSLSDENGPGEKAVAGGSVEHLASITEIDDFLLSLSRETANRDRQIFWLYYRNGLTAREIAAIPFMGLSLKGVQSSIQRTTQDVRERFKSKSPDRPNKLDVTNEGFRAAESF